MYVQLLNSTITWVTLPPELLQIINIFPKGKVSTCEYDPPMINCDLRVGAISRVGSRVGSACRFCLTSAGLWAKFDRIAFILNRPGGVGGSDCGGGNQSMVT